MKRIALFGTSADPPTSGHQAIVKWLSEHYDLVAVWAADNPFKSHQTLLKHRTAMLGLMIEEVKASALRQNVDLHPELSSHRTLETVKKAREQWEDAELILVIGSDLVGQLPHWYQIEDLLQQVQLLVVPRPGYTVEEKELEQLRKLGGRIAIADLTGPDTSSTAYRESGDTEALTPPVEAYIHRQHLYKCQYAPQKILPIW